MINAERGEVSLSIGGRTRTLCLTMNALAVLEHGFGVTDLAGLGERLKTMDSRDLRLVLEALSGGPVAGDVDPAMAARACAECFRRAFSPIRTAA